MEIGENINRYLEEININNPNERELKDEYKKIYKKIQIIDNNEYKRFYNSELVAKQRKDLLVICDRLLTEIKESKNKKNVNFGIIIGCVVMAISLLL